MKTTTTDYTLARQLIVRNQTLRGIIGRDRIDEITMDGSKPTEAEAEMLAEIENNRTVIIGPRLPSVLPTNYVPRLVGRPVRNIWRSRK